MKAAVIDGDTVHLTDESGTVNISSEGFRATDDMIAVGGRMGNRDPVAVLAETYPDSGYTNVVLGRNTMYFTDAPEFPIRLPRPIKTMWDAAGTSSGERIDEAVETLLQYAQDDMWDAAVPVEGTEYRASDYLAGILMVRDSVVGNVADRTMRTVVCGRVCAFRSFRNAMPEYVRCVTPAQLSKDICERLIRNNKEE